MELRSSYEIKLEEAFKMKCQTRPGTNVVIQCIRMFWKSLTNLFNLPQGIDPAYETTNWWKAVEVTMK